MKIVAVICEYNPFHKGHELQIEEIKRRIPDAFVLSLMSGDFVQRGGLAVLPKYERAKAAVICGADAVLSLPFPFCCGSAEYFASAAISILKRLNCVDYICFGSECADKNALVSAAERCIGEEYLAALKIKKEKEKNSPSAHIVQCIETYSELYGEDLPSGSNDMLALEYIKAMLRAGFDAEIIVHGRFGGYGATFSREKYFASAPDFSDTVPAAAAKIYSALKPVSEEYVSSYILGSLRTANAEEIKKYAELGGGLYSRIRAASERADSVAELYGYCATKKYTDAKIRRAVFYSVFKVTEKELKATPRYTQLLAMREDAGKTLKTIVSGSDIPVITKVAHYKKEDEQTRAAFEMEALAEKIYGLAFTGAGNLRKDALRSPFVLKEP